MNFIFLPLQKKGQGGNNYNSKVMLFRKGGKRRELTSAIIRRKERGCSCVPDSSRWLSSSRFNSDQRCRLEVKLADAVSRCSLHVSKVTLQQRGIFILSDWSWRTSSHQARWDGQRIGGYFALIRWLRSRNLEEANDNREEGGGVRGCIHQRARSDQTCVHLAS